MTLPAQPAPSPPPYYASKADSLRDLFGAKSVSVGHHQVVVDGLNYTVIDDVIILLEPSEWPVWLRARAPQATPRAQRSERFAVDIQDTFGSEWRKYPCILPEHEEEFRQYFDVLDPSSLGGVRTLDLGCGIGRWSFFLKDRVREMVLVDFSDAIFVARDNLAAARNSIFFLGDITRLPFRDNCADVVVCLGVLHHLPIDALKAVRLVSRYARRSLIYLYSALDSRPGFQRWLLALVTLLRLIASRVHNENARSLFTRAAAWTLYMPLIGVGHVLSLVGMERHVPLYQFYRGKSGERIRQDVYDRFFTRIEQRVSRREIEELRDTFDQVTISSQLPQWHFLCERD